MPEFEDVALPELKPRTPVSTQRIFDLRRREVDSESLSSIEEVAQEGPRSTTEVDHSPGIRRKTLPDEPQALALPEPLNAAPSMECPVVVAGLHLLVKVQQIFRAATDQDSSVSEIGRAEAMSRTAGCSTAEPYNTATCVQTVDSDTVRTGP